MPTPLGLPAPGEWYRHPNFDSESRTFYCSVGGTVRRDDEDFIIRGPFIDHEGFFDITQQSARQLARLIGWVPPDEADARLTERREVEAELAAVSIRADEQAEAVASLTRENARLLDESAAAEEALRDALQREDELTDRIAELEIDLQRTESRLEAAREGAE